MKSSIKLEAEIDQKIAQKRRTGIDKGIMSRKKKEWKHTHFWSRKSKHVSWVEQSRILFSWIEKVKICKDSFEEVKIYQNLVENIEK